MAKSNLVLKAENNIRNAFRPQIAVLCSEDAENACLKNNLRFIDMIQPFSKQYTEGKAN